MSLFLETCNHVHMYVKNNNNIKLSWIRTSHAQLSVLLSLCHYTNISSGSFSKTKGCIKTKSSKLYNYTLNLKAKESVNTIFALL